MRFARPANETDAGDRYLKTFYNLDVDSNVTMTRIALLISINVFSIFGCKSNMTSKQGIKEALGNVSDEELKPHYKTVFTPDSVEIENVKDLLTKDSVDQVDCMTILSNSCNALKADFNNYLLDSYQTLEYLADRLTYTDISNIARFVIWKFKSNDTVCFDKIFENAEIILEKGDEATRTLIIVGLFEDIQNIGGWHKVDYYKGFDRWLRPNSKKAWKELIDLWEKER